MFQRTRSLALFICFFLDQGSAQQGYMGEIEIFDGLEHHLVPLTPSTPARLCTRPQDQPPWWARPFQQVRLRIALPPKGQVKPSSWFPSRQVANLQLERQLHEPRGFCQLHLLPEVLCPDCTSRTCRVEPVEPWGRPSVRDAYLSSAGGCITVRSLPDGVSKVKAAWETTWDPSVPVYAIVGLVFLWGYKFLRENSTLHALIGGSLSFGAILLMVMYWVNQQVRRNVPGFVPFGHVFTSVATLALAFSAAARQIIKSWLPSDVSALIWRVLELRDPIWNLPIGWMLSIGWLAVTVGAVSMGANASVRYFASPTDPEGDVPFEIGPDGRRIDALPPLPWPQFFLGNVIWMSGVYLLVTSTHVDLVSALLLLVALTLDSVVHIARQLYQRAWEDHPGPGAFTPLVSLETYQEQGRVYTQMAMEALKRHLQQTPDAMLKVRDDSELRLRRFSTGGTHFQAPLKMEEESTWTGRCALL